MLLVSCSSCEGCAAVLLPAAPGDGCNGPQAPGLPCFCGGCALTVPLAAWALGCGDEVQSSPQLRTLSSSSWKCRDLWQCLGREDEQPGPMTGWAGWGLRGDWQIAELLHHLCLLACHIISSHFRLPRVLLHFFRCRRTAVEDRGQRPLSYRAWPIERWKDKLIWEVGACQFTPEKR